MKIVKNLLHKMMISCEKAAFLISKSQDNKLRLSERIQLSMHLLACKYCHWYDREIKNLNEIFIGITKNTLDGKIVYTLDADKRLEIEEKVNKKMKNR